ncbi:MAG: hypothetical protein WCC60_15050 [Ilumatobacteraceae bacterium]
MALDARHGGSDGEAADAAGSRSGLLPPDGVAWPPEPAPTVPVPRAPDALPTTSRRPLDADTADWRTMPADVPAGYQGSPSAPPAPAPRVEGWSVIAFVLAIVGVIPLLWAVPLAPVLALAFGVTGRKACSLDPTRKGKVFATVAVVVGGATLLAVAGAVASGRLTLLDF